MHYSNVLIAYWLIFFWKKLTNPLSLSTSELLSKHFPHWIHIGRSLRQGKFPYKDNYFVYPACIPFLSMFYPPHLISAFLGSFLDLDRAFSFLVSTELIHYLLGSFLSFHMFNQWYSPEISLFGAITLTYMAYSIKLINPCIAYTVCWIPGMFIQGHVGWISFGMALLSGYYPILVYITPFAVFLNPGCAFGACLGILQLVPMLWYWPKSVRANAKVSKKTGSVPTWRFIDLLIPGYKGQANGLIYPETQMFLGWLPLLFVPFSVSRAWLPCLMSFVMSLGVIRPPFRNASRFLYTFCFFLVWMAISGLNRSGLDSHALIGLFILQGYSLLRNEEAYPTHPFTEPVQPPSFWFSGRQHLPDGYPYFTGYILNESVASYKGGFSLK